MISNKKTLDELAMSHIQHEESVFDYADESVAQDEVSDADSEQNDDDDEELADDYE
jgi:hypothetical protein